MRLALLGLPPATNNLYAIVRGRQVLTEAGRAWHAAVAAAARAAWGRPPSAGPVAVLLTLHLGAYDRDADGSVKAVLDGLAPRRPGGGRDPVVFRDDRQVVLLVVRKVRAPAGALPWTSLVVRELRAAPQHRAPAVRGGDLGFATTLVGPTTNNAYAVAGGTRRKTAQARAVADAYRAGWAAIAGPGRPWLAGAARVVVRQGYTADRRDVDGGVKLLLDAARGILWPDDRAVARLSLAKGRVSRGGAPVIEGTVGPLRLGA